MKLSLFAFTRKPKARKINDLSVNMQPSNGASYAPNNYIQPIDFRTRTSALFGTPTPQLINEYNALGVWPAATPRDLLGLPDPMVKAYYSFRYDESEHFFNRDTRPYYGTGLSSNIRLSDQLSGSPEWYSNSVPVPQLYNDD
jgi:hypothetical protein